MVDLRLAIVRQRYHFDGGAERFISLALDALSNNGLKLNIITRYWPDNLKGNYYIHICNPKGKLNRLTSIRNFAHSARKYWQNNYFDLIQSHERIVGCDIFRAGDGVHQAWLEQLARVTPIYKRLWYRSISRFHRYMIDTERDMFNSLQLKKIICNSIMIRNDIIHYYNVPEDKFALIYNAIDSHQFIPASGKQKYISRMALSIPAHACVFIFVGSGFVRKGLQQAIKAIANTNRFLIIVGRDKHQFRYHSLIYSMGCYSRIRFIGIKKNLLPYYHAADALILPTLYDPFPNVILEAMSCGLPVITTTQCGATEFIEHGREGFICDALDIVSLTKFIAEMPTREQDPDMSIAARQRVSTYTPTNMSNQLAKLYLQLLS